MTAPFLMWQRLCLKLNHSLKIAKFDEWIIKLKNKKINNTHYNQTAVPLPVALLKKGHFSEAKS